MRMGEKRRHSQVWLCTDALKAKSVCELSDVDVKYVHKVLLITWIMLLRKLIITFNVHIVFV